MFVRAKDKTNYLSNQNEISTSWKKTLDVGPYTIEQCFQTLKIKTFIFSIEDNFVKFRNFSPLDWMTENSSITRQYKSRSLICLNFDAEVLCWHLCVLNFITVLYNFKNFYTYPIINMHTYIHTYVCKEFQEFCHYL